VHPVIVSAKLAIDLPVPGELPGDRVPLFARQLVEVVTAAEDV
jgi:hypothetical protein